METKKWYQKGLEWALEKENTEKPWYKRRILWVGALVFYLLILLISVAILLFMPKGRAVKNKEIPNVFGVYYEDAIEILEEYGFRVKVLGSDPYNITHLYIPMDENCVFKIDDYVQDEYGKIYRNKEKLDVEDRMISKEGLVVLHYKKTNSSAISTATPTATPSATPEPPSEQIEEETKPEKTTTPAPKTTTTSSASAPAWKEFLKEYEDWVDDYIEIVKKYKNNPSDMSILSDYSNMMTEMAEWTEKTGDMEDDLKNASPSEVAKYSSELSRIVAKLAKAAY